MEPRYVTYEFRNPDIPYVLAFADGEGFRRIYVQQSTGLSEVLRLEGAAADCAKIRAAGLTSTIEIDLELDGGSKLDSALKDFRLDDFKQFCSRYKKQTK